jgi:N-methylhydantoinase A
MRFACDTGGTFTDLIVEDEALGLRMYKATTTPHDPVQGVLNALRLAAADCDLSLAELLGRGDLLIHGTTHAINAIITGNAGKTAFLSTAKHPDILVRRGGVPRQRRCEDGARRHDHGRRRLVDLVSQSASANSRTAAE